MQRLYLKCFEMKAARVVFIDVAGFALAPTRLCVACAVELRATKARQLDEIRNSIQISHVETIKVQLLCVVSVWSTLW